MKDHLTTFLHLAEKEIRVAAERRMMDLFVKQLADNERRERAALKIQALYRGWKIRGPAEKGKKGKGKKKR